VILLKLRKFDAREIYMFYSMHDLFHTFPISFFSSLTLYYSKLTCRMKAIAHWHSIRT